MLGTYLAHVPGNEDFIIFIILQITVKCHFWDHDPLKKKLHHSLTLELIES